MLMQNDIVIHNDYVEIILRNKKGQETGRTLIDLEDLEIVSSHTWSINTHGYARASKDNKYLGLHKLITKTGSNEIVDHINRNRLDNRKYNLRIVTRNENATNKGKQSNNKSGVIGVSLYKRDMKWVAEIKFNGVKNVIGRYIEKENAIKARLLKEHELLGEYAPQKHLFKQYGIGVDIDG